MICNDHYIPRSETLVYATSSIGNNDCVNPQLSIYPHWQNNIFNALAFIVMKPSLHGNHLSVLIFTADKLASMSFNGSPWKARYVPVWNHYGFFNIITYYPQPGTQNQTNSRAV